MAEKSAAEKSNLKNSSGERNGNDHGLLQEQRQFFELVLTATEKTTLNQVHSGPKSGSTIVFDRMA
ncbi:MAG: hypothetical protein COV48_11480 [Elusimicrobia bacterium CG11_big_fil_rev_8_21_14_0_20_64_6]|nr:MAG: hypothetical protein COV48_11480 [Elusimicrobia bacterium CG11_big_fil_rev_8_21_14_0_20_64_6]